MRFLDPLGGLASQLNNRSISLHLAATESIGDSTSYDTLLASQLEELGRARANRTAGAVNFMGLLQSEPPRLQIQANAQAEMTSQNPAATRAPAKAPPVDPKATGERAWIPKKQYMAQLAAAMRASDDAASDSAPDAPFRPPSPVRSRRRSRALTA